VLKISSNSPFLF